MATLPNEQLLTERFTNVLATEAAIGAGLLGIVLAGLSLLVAFLNEELMRVLQSKGDGLAADVWPFSFTAALAALATASAVWFLAVASDTEPVWMRVGAGVSTWLFIWTLFGVLALVRQVHEYGHLRVVAAESRARQPEDTD